MPHTSLFDRAGKTSAASSCPIRSFAPVNAAVLTPGVTAQLAGRRTAPPTTKTRGDFAARQEAVQHNAPAAPGRAPGPLPTPVGAGVVFVRPRSYEQRLPQDQRWPCRGLTANLGRRGFSDDTFA